jgi:predicted metalloprotease with PDZ domain
MVRDTDNAVSYYVKGPVVGFLLDARIRRATDGKRSLDDVMRMAYDRYSGPQGFTPEEFVAVAEEVSGVDLDDWFHHHLDSTKELDYTEALEWFGLQIDTGSDPKTQWTLSVRGDQTQKQRDQFLDLTTSPSASTAPK